MRISDVLWKAANRHLSPSFIRYRRGRRTRRYTCDAIALALTGDPACGGYNPRFTNSDVSRFVKHLGCDSNSLRLFDEFEEHDAQQARYAWLMFAHEIAKEVESGELKL